MTYCIGWKTKTSVFLVGDSARTIEFPDAEQRLTKPISTFGENSLKSKKYIVEEFQNKCYQVNNKVALAYAGDTDTAIGILQSFETCIDENNVVASFQKAIDSCRGERIEVQFLMAFLEAGETRLYGYNVAQRERLTELTGFAEIGSLSVTIYSELVKNFHNLAIQKVENDYQQFYKTIAYLQHLAIHNYLYEHSVGGFFCGLMVNATGVRWNDDSSYYLYNLGDHGIYDVDVVKSIIRYDTPIIFSSLTGNKEVFVSHSNAYLNNNQQLLDNEIEPLFQVSNSKIFYFLAKGISDVIVIKTNGFNSGYSNPFFDEYFDEKKALQLIVKRGLMDIFTMLPQSNRRLGDVKVVYAEIT